VAHFKKALGSAGDWSDASYSIKAAVGETFGVILTGGGPQGPDGKWEDIVVEPDPSLHVTGGLDPKPSVPLGSDEKLYRYTVMSPGTVKLRAKRPTGQDYATPLLVICTAVATAGNELVYFCANEIMPNKWRWVNVDIIPFDTPENFLRLFENFRDSGRRIRGLVIASHGQPGAIHTGGKIVANAPIWRSNRGRGYDAIFYAGASVKFKGCNVAEGPLGREFLEECGKTLFWRSGGTVIGSDSTFIGFSFYDHPRYGPDAYSQAWGNVISIKFKPGGEFDSEQQRSIW